ncbi:hypothetical protein [Streptomyces sp. CBMA156]|uniref:hypothetical protein n=1 Tax=Streptomyces sp. CBMA156 TaxID=1930280 RepID=UPI0016619BAC|nr:hypothetical protein [Streptomyces sp. CBMA156]MBD0669329.1 hypothetical protein [Streptomyces sp. CBMA156]
MTRKPYRLAATALAALLAAPLFTACKNADQAIDCGKWAITLTGDVQDLADSAVNVGQLTDESRRKQTIAALHKVVEDAKKIRHTGGDQTSEATDRLSKAVDNAIDSVSKGKDTNLKPITDAAADVGKACAGS